MANAAGSPFLALAAELEARDERIAGEISALAALDGRVAAVKERASATGAYLERLPAERAHLEQALADAEEARCSAEEALAVAARAVTRLEARRSPDEEQLASARRVEARAHDNVEVTQRVLARVVTRRAVLEEDTVRVQAELPLLEAEARGLSAALLAAPRVSHGGGLDPAPGLDGLLEWARRARAAVLVARGGLESERERTVREANELAAAALGETLGATRVAHVRERLERALRA